MLKTLLVFAVVILALVLALMLRVEYQSPRQPNVSITFLGFTNDSTGARLAKFVVSNSEPSAVHVSWPLIETIGGEGRFVGGIPAVGVIGAHASKTVSFPSPTNQPPWRLYLSVDPDVGLYRNLKHFIFYQMLKAGFKPKYQTMPYSLRSDWIGAEK